MADDTEASTSQAVAEQEPPADETVSASSAELPQVQDEPAGPGGRIDVLLETTVPVTVRLGQVSMEIRRLLQMGPGSVIKLDKQVGEPVEIFLRDRKFALGQLVVVDDRIAVRITQILSGASADQKPRE